MDFSTASNLLFNEAAIYSSKPKLHETFSSKSLLDLGKFSQFTLSFLISISFLISSEIHLGFLHSTAASTLQVLLYLVASPSH